MNELLAVFVGGDDESAREDDSVEHGLPALLENWTECSIDSVAVYFVPKDWLL